MKIAALYLLFLFALIVFAFIYIEIKNKKLLETVTKSHRGTKTERKLVLILLKAGFPAQTIFHDLYLINRPENYTQIDLVLATKVGIIVFEVKKYSGWLFGTGYQNKWTQVLAYGKQKYYFYNPIFQNKKHVEDLKKKLTPFENIPLYSVVVFFGDCEFKEITNIPQNTYLVKSKKILEVVHQIIENNEHAIYTNKRDVAKVLKAAVANGEDNKIAEKHIKNINEMLGKHRVLD